MTTEIEQLQKAIELGQQAAEILRKSQMALPGFGTTNMSRHEIVGARREGLLNKDEARQMHGEAHHVGYTRTNASGTSSTIQAKNPRAKLDELKTHNFGDSTTFSQRMQHHAATSGAPQHEIDRMHAATHASEAAQSPEGHERARFEHAGAALQASDPVVKLYHEDAAKHHAGKVKEARDAAVDKVAQNNSPELGWREAHDLAETKSHDAWNDDGGPTHKDAAEALRHSSKLHEAAADAAGAAGDEEASMHHEHKAEGHARMAEEHEARHHADWVNEQQAKQLDKLNKEHESRVATPAKANKTGDWHKERSAHHAKSAQEHRDSSRWEANLGGDEQADGNDEAAEDHYAEAEYHDRKAEKHQKVSELHGKLADKLGTTPKPATKPAIPASRVSVDTQNHFNSHLKEPKGRGGWMFSKKRDIDFGTDKQGEDYITTPSMTYADAKKHAKAWAASKGHSVIHVMP